MRTLQAASIVVGTLLAQLMVTAAEGKIWKTQTPDHLTFIVTMEDGDERWSLSANRIPSTETGQSPILNTLTGNVFKRDGSPPSFLYCTKSADSQGDLEDPSAKLNFSCFASDPCERTSSQCADGWRPLSDVSLSGAFFLAEAPADPEPTRTPAPSPPSCKPPVAGHVVPPQDHCRNGQIDKGEQCDRGQENWECTQTYSSEACAWCGFDVPIGTVELRNFISTQLPLPCAKGEILERSAVVHGRRCTADDPAVCRVFVGESFIDHECRSVVGIETPSEPFPRRCWDYGCVQAAATRGTCVTSRNGDDCVLEVDGITRVGICRTVGHVSYLVCQTDAVELLGRPR